MMTKNELVDLLRAEINKTGGRLNGSAEGGAYQRNEGIRTAITVVEKYFDEKWNPPAITAERFAEQERQTVSV